LEPTTYHWIGTGSAFNPALGHTSFMVYRETGRRLLVDCGATVPLRLIETGDAKHVTDVLLTHLHADHIGGLEGLAFYIHYALQRRGDQRLHLHVASETFAHDLWEHALKAGMSHTQDGHGKPLDATMDTYFQVHVGDTVEVPGLPEAKFLPTRHIVNMENYAVQFVDGVFYSGDTVELPPQDARLIFQDCQVHDSTPGDIHISYEELVQGLPLEVRKKTYLTHLGHGYAQRDPARDGFAGYVLPDMKFQVNGDT